MGRIQPCCHHVQCYAVRLSISISRLQVWPLPSPNAGPANWPMRARFGNMIHAVIDPLLGQVWLLTAHHTHFSKSFQGYSSGFIQLSPRRGRVFAIWTDTIYILVNVQLRKAARDYLKIKIWFIWVGGDSVLPLSGASFILGVKHLVVTGTKGFEVPWWDGDYIGGN